MATYISQLPCDQVSFILIVSAWYCSDTENEISRFTSQQDNNNLTNYKTLTHTLTFLNQTASQGPE